MIRTAVLLAALGVLVGCGGSEAPANGGGPAAPEGSDPEAQITDQIEFDFSLAHDRTQFAPVGLEFRASIGPYAVYDVTGADPKLEGPWVRYPGDVGYAMLCAASNYFTDGATNADPLKLSLIAGPEVVFVDTQMMPMMMGLCTNPTDDYGGNIPDPTSGSSGGDTPSGGDPTVPRLAKLSIDLSPAPAVGSTILLRRAALSVDKPGHNDSHVVPKICCDDSQCGLTKPDPAGPSPR